MIERLKTNTTAFGTKYVTGAYAALIAATTPSLMQDALANNLMELDPEFKEWAWELRENEPEADSIAPRVSTLLQFAGQLCYLALGKKRTPFREARQYLARILEQRHGSVLEHANFTFLFLGVDRAMTHELVRHRAGMAYSQVSQRYTGPEHVRFVMPYEDRQHILLRNAFVKDIDINLAQYKDRITLLQALNPALEGEARTEYRKRIHGSARSVLGNYVEAPIVVTGNARAWRHVLTMRCSRHADVRIREPMMQVLDELIKTLPEVFEDFTVTTLKDGSREATPKYEKP